MALSSSSTRAQVVAAYDDNSRYDVNASASEAADFIQACRIMLRLPERVRGALSESQWNHSQVRQQLERAESWLASRQSDVPTTTPNVTARQISMERFER